MTNQVITPYYFAYEDLLDDWDKLVESELSSSTDARNRNIPSSPEVHILCLFHFPFSLIYVV